MFQASNTGDARNTKTVALVPRPWLRRQPSLAPDRQVWVVLGHDFGSALLQLRDINRLDDLRRVLVKLGLVVW
jgi:hypothetical protein